MKGGGFLLRDLPAATYVLQASAAAEGDTATVDVRAGMTATVTLQSQGKAQVTGTALDFRTRQPVEGAECGWHQWAANRKEMYFAASGRDRVKSDPRGQFVLDVPAGKKILITCFPRDWANEEVHTPTVLLSLGATAAVEVLYVRRKSATTDRGYVGLRPSLHPPTVIERVTPDGPAARAGLRKGDAIIEVDGVRVDELNPAAAFLLVLDHPIGDTATVAIRRGSANQVVQITIGRIPDSTDRWEW